MAWTIQANFRAITSYDKALKAWEKGVIFRGALSQYAPRGLVDKRKKHMTVEQTEAGDIILRLYQHPTVTWHPDNSFTVCGYDSRSTIMFANKCLPDNISTWVGSGHFSVVVHDGGKFRRVYKVADTITFRQREGMWKPDQVSPWSVPVVNKARAAVALRDSGYNEFREWLNVYVQMSKPPEDRIDITADKTVLNMLRDRTTWRELTACYPRAWLHPENMLGDLRQVIYAEYGCNELKSVPFLG